jgi:hypothetical protein
MRLSDNMSKRVGTKANKKVKRDIPLSSSQREVIGRWNDGAALVQEKRGRMRDSRNNQVKENEYGNLVPLIDKALAKIGKEKIYELMDSYFECCKSRGHIWEGKNHGYSNVGGFLKKLINYEISRQLPWWLNECVTKGEGGSVDMEVDDYPEITKELADTFASKFLGRSSYGLKKGTKEYAKFVKGARLIGRIAALNKMPSADPVKSLIRCLLNCIEEFNDGKVFPGHLVSKNVWSIQMPQGLRDLGISVSGMDEINDIVAGEFE